MLIIPIKKSDPIDPDILSIFISFQSSSFTLQMEFKGFRKGRMNSILLHKCSIWMQIFGHLSNVHRTQFSGSVSTGWTNYLYESSMNTDECRSLVDTSEEGISGACGWFFRRNAVATYVVLDYSVSLSTITTTLSLSPPVSLRLSGNLFLIPSTHTWLIIILPLVLLMNEHYL